MKLFFSCSNRTLTGYLRVETAGGNRPKVGYTSVVSLSAKPNEGSTQDEEVIAHEVSKD